MKDAQGSDELARTLDAQLASELPKSFTEPVKTAPIDRVGKVIRNHHKVIGRGASELARQAVTLPSGPIVSLIVVWSTVASPA